MPVIDRLPRAPGTYRIPAQNNGTGLPRSQAPSGTGKKDAKRAEHSRPAWRALRETNLARRPAGPSAWYQSDIQTNDEGNGSATVRGIFDAETFSVSPGGTTTFAPTHQYHLGVWFNDPSVPFNLGCEPGAAAPIVTPFNGEQNAGIQVVNTAQFPVNAGPLSHVHR